MARGLWAAFSIVVGVVAFAVVAGSEAALTKPLAMLAGMTPGGLQLGAYGAVGLAATAFALVIFLFLIVVPELTDIARLDGVLRALRALHPLHEASPVQLLRALAGAPLLNGAAAALRPSLRAEDRSERSEAVLVSDMAPDTLIVPAILVGAQPRVRFLRAVLAMLVLSGATLALLNTALPQTLVAHADGATAAAIGTATLAALPLAVAIVLWAGHEILRDITRLQLRLVQDELRALVSPARPAAGAAFDGEALRAALRGDMETLQHSLTRFMDAALRRLEAAPPPATIDISAHLGELPQIAGALGALREELTATVQVARDATKLLFSSAQHIEDIANLMREGGTRPPSAPIGAPAPSVAPASDPDDQTGDLRRAIGELLAETSAQAARLPKF